MLNLELRLHAELSALLDRERLVLQVLQGTGLGEVDDDIWAAFDFERERMNDAGARIVGVGDGFAGAGADAERGFPAGERLIFLVCREEYSVWRQLSSDVRGGSKDKRWALHLQRQCSVGSCSTSRSLHVQLPCSKELTQARTGCWK